MLIRIPLDKVRETLVGMINVTSNDATRYTLEGVRVRVDKDTLEFAASDGHIASRVAMSTHGVEGVEKTEKILSKELLKEIKKIKAREAGKYVLELLDKEVKIVGDMLEKRHFYIEAEYPNIDLIYKGAEGGVSEDYVGVNAELLAIAAESLARANESYKHGVSPVKIYLKLDKDAKGNVSINRTAPIVLKAGDNKALVMPMKI